MSSRLSYRIFLIFIGHVARYAPSRKSKTYGTIAEIHRKLIHRTYHDKLGISAR